MPIFKTKNVSTLVSDIKSVAYFSFKSLKKCIENRGGALFTSSTLLLVYTNNSWLIRRDRLAKMRGKEETLRQLEQKKTYHSYIH